MTDSSSYSETVEKARAYYNSEDADNFYFTVWGGEDLHIGIYEKQDEPIFDASRRTVERIASRLDLPEGARVLDIGAGYGGSARHLARIRGWRMTALNLSEVENERDRKMNKEQGLEDWVDVVDGAFEKLPFEDASFDGVWCQDSLLHSGERERVFREVDRVLQPGGYFVFTDPIQKADADVAALQPVYDRIHLDSLGSVEAYDEYARKLGWANHGFQALPEHLPAHYQRVHDEVVSRYDELKATISTEYLDRMLTGLQHWVKQGRAGNLSWGIFLYQKPE